MKLITNWRNATVADTEADGLLDIASKLHVLSFNMATKKAAGSIEGWNTERVVAFFNWHIANKVPIVMHNGICFDVPLIEKLFGIDLSDLMLIDTLPLSWYLNTDRKQHGLASFLEDYGIEKPEIEDWEGLTYEEYKHRCEEDVKINKALWGDFIERLEDMYSKSKEAIDSGYVVGTKISDDEVLYIDQFKGTSVDEHIDRLLSHLMFKMDCLKLQEDTKWEADREMIAESISKIEPLLEKSKEELESVMPPVAIYSARKKPAKPYKKNGELSASGLAWNVLLDKRGKTDDAGNPLVIMDLENERIKELTGYEPPNINSVEQIKDFLFSKGWVPATYKFVKDKKAMQEWANSGFERSLKPEPRRVPQISKDGDDGKELCESVLELAEEVPEIMSYAKFTTLKNRRDTLLSMLENSEKDGFLVAGAGGFTNTLRLKHRGLVNLPGVDKPYGKEIRGGLIAGKGKVLLGSDLSSLEDRVKHHFMLAHDPEYVATMMADDFDPHILMAYTAGLITKADYEDFKKGIKTDKVKAARKVGKCVNYASVYNASPETIARSADTDIKTGKKLHKSYWELNWAVKKIAEEQEVIEDKSGNKWLVNPVNGFCYSLRKESDRFSTLCQGTGAYFFDMWLDNLITEMYNRWGKKQLVGQFHDELILRVADSPKWKCVMEEVVKESLSKVNTTFGLRRALGCDVQWGYRYSDIH